MREDLRDYIAQQKFKNFKVSDELPFSNSGTPLVTKNPKTIYVDSDQVTTESFMTFTNGIEVPAEVTVSKVYFSTDAKQQPTDYATVVSAISAWRQDPSVATYFRKELDMVTSFQNDLQITEFEFRFTKLS